MSAGLAQSTDDGHRSAALREPGRRDLPPGAPPAVRRAPPRSGGLRSRRGDCTSSTALQATQTDRGSTLDPLHHILLIAREDLRQTFRSTRATLLLGIYGLVSLLSGAIVIWMSRSMAAQFGQMPDALPPGAEAGDSAAIQEAITLGVLEALIDDPEQAAFLAAIPLLVLFFFWANRTFLPWLAALIGFDSVGREIESGTVRYYTLRTRRSSLVLGRYLSNAALIVLLTALTHLLIFGFGALFIEGFARVSAAGHLVRLWLLVVPVALAWFAFILCLSTLLRPYQALLTGVAAILGTAMAGWVTRFSERLSPLRWVLPGEYGGFLLSHRVTEQLIGAGAFLGVSKVFVSLAVITLERRDV